MKVDWIAENEVAPEDPPLEDSSPSDPLDWDVNEGTVKAIGDCGIELPELEVEERDEGAEGSETLRGLVTSLEKRFVWAL